MNRRSGGSVLVKGDMRNGNQVENEEHQTESSTIYNITDACFRLFDRLSSAAHATVFGKRPPEVPDSVSPYGPLRDIQSLLNSFAFWVDYTGALAPISASLDDRLHDHDEVKEMVMELLEMVERNLHSLEKTWGEESASSDTESQYWLSAITSALDRLHFLARAIRKASSRQSDQDMLKFTSADDKYFRNLTVSYVKWKFPNARPSLRDHMGDHLAGRRVALLQQNSHANKLKIRRRPRPTEVLKADQQPAQPLEENNTEIPVSARVPHMQKSTADSRITQESKMDKAAALRSSESSVQGGDMSAEYPDPPKTNSGETYVPCPYCMEPLSVEPLPGDRRQSGPKNEHWRSHVNQDLQPYVCLFRGCDNASFAHKSDWSKHMNVTHSEDWPAKVHATVWVCDLIHSGDVAVDFDNETDWRAHMLDTSLYPGRTKPPTDAQLDALAIRKQHVARRDRYNCLFCEEKPASIAKLGDRGNSNDMAKLLEDHIATHIKSLSFLALPSLGEGVRKEYQASTTLNGRLLSSGSTQQPPSGAESMDGISLTFKDGDGEGAPGESADKDSWILNPNDFQRLLRDIPRRLPGDLDVIERWLGDLIHELRDNISEIESETNLPALHPSKNFAPPVQDDTTDDLIRSIDIIKPGSHERTYRAKALFDSGNPHENLISRNLVDGLGISPSPRKPSSLRRSLTRLIPWTGTAKAYGNQAKAQLRNMDGTLITSNYGTITISWYGKNRHDLRDPILYFQPVRYETTHIVVSAANCGADVIFSWKEVKSLKLRHRFTGAIQRPPTPKTDPGDKKYQDYEQRRAEIKAARDEKRGKGEIQPPGPGNTTQTGR